MARSPSPAQPFIVRKTKTNPIDSSALHAYYYQLERRNDAEAIVFPGGGDCRAELLAHSVACALLHAPPGSG
jgi:hypothetical protein